MSDTELLERIGYNSRHPAEGMSKAAFLAMALGYTTKTGGLLGAAGMVARNMFWPQMKGMDIGHAVARPFGKLLRGPLGTLASGGASLAARAASGTAEFALDNPVTTFVMAPMLVGAVAARAKQQLGRMAGSRPRSMPDVFSRIG